MMSRETYATLMGLILEQFQALLAVENTGAISVFSGKLTNNLDAMCDAVVRDVGDTAGFTSRALDCWSEEDPYPFSFKDTVVSIPVPRTFNDWEALYDFFTSDFVKQYADEYEKMFWG